MAVPARKKTSFTVDYDKVSSAQKILGTKTLTETVDAALAEVIDLHRRQQLVEMLFDPGKLDLDDPEIMSSAWR